MSARRLRSRWSALTLLVLAATACGPARALPEDDAMPPAASSRDWREIERLLDEQKLQAAAERLDALEQATRERGDDAALARILVRRTQVAVALGGYATAVETLRARPWPEDPLARAAVELYAAFALASYLDQYGWEIARRERVVEGGALDLERWTREQIAAEADRAFARVWAERERLGAVPAKDFEYLRPNDYPDGIRPTLRDAVAYLWAEQLGDSSHWSAAELEATWKLDLAALAAGTAAEPAAEALDDPRRHPLARLSTLLGDLERWHRGRGETGAAIEALRERLRILHGAFAADEDRERLRHALATALAGLAGDPWWAMGMAELAAMERESDAPEALLTARATAIAGEEAFPGSPGARACRRLREEIEAPSFELEAMAVDGARRRSVAVRHRNLTTLHLRAYRLNDEPFGSRPMTWEQWSDARLRPLLRGQPAASWSVDLPATADFRDHRTWVEPPLDGRGRYLIVASAEPGFTPRGNRLQAVALRLSDLVLLHDVAGDATGATRLAVRAVSGADGAPLAGADVRLYRWRWEQTPELLETTSTDRAGFVELQPPPPSPSGNNFAVVVRSSGDEAVWSESYWRRHDDGEPGGRVATLIFTDRSIYRPGQKLLWKTLTWAGRAERGELRAAAGRAVHVRLIDPNGETVANAEATSNDFGTASGELEIPAGRLPGDWRLEADPDGSAGIAVEEYQRPTFEVTLAPPAEAPRLNRPVEIAGEARYYFGLPLTGGRVAWRVVREPLREWGWRGLWAPPEPPRTVAGGAAAVGAEGRFTFTFTPEADERTLSGCGCFRYRVEAEATDAGGETRGGSLSLAVGRVSIRLQPSEERFLLEAGTASRLGLRREDLDGAGRAGATAWRLVELEQPGHAPLPADLPEAVKPAAERFATPGDRLRPRWAPAPSSAEILAGWGTGRVVAQGEVRHGEDGRAAVDLPALAPGAYRLVAETRDDDGETAKLEQGLLVAPARRGETVRLALPLELRFAAPVVEVGGTARLFVHSGRPGQTILLDLVRGDVVLERRTLVAGRDPEWIELRVRAADRGGLGARATVVADHQVVARQAAIEVPWSDRRLEVALSSFRDRLAPGGTETFRVTVRGPGGEPLAAGAAELVASMYDRSLDLFRPHQVPRGEALWPVRGEPSPLGHELAGRGPVWGAEEDWHRWTEPPAFSADAFVVIDPYGVGGPGAGGPRILSMRAGVAEMVAEAPVAKLADDAPAAPQPEPAPPPVAVRSDFAETAFWRPHLVTGEDGSVAVEFRVPESLTSWRFWVSAWTRELASGYLEREVTTTKELMVRPYLPRFLREGDRAELRVIVRNAGETRLDGALRFAVVDPASGDDLSARFALPSGGATAGFSIAPGAESQITVPVVAPAGVRPLAVRVEARAGALADGELRPLPLLPARLRLTASRFAALRGAERRELVFDALREDDPTRVDEQLVVTVDADLFTSMLAALPYLVDYPYDCTEQTMNRFVSTAILGSLFDRHPGVARRAAALAERSTPWERFDADDPYRRTALEETPWLRESRGGSGEDEALARVLDPAVARAVRADALTKLERAQLPSGAFPWFPGGPPSPYMTLYLMAGFARVAEFGGEIPDPMVRRAWAYLAGEIDGEWWRRATRDDCCWELLTFANYVASSYPDPSVMGGVLPEGRRAEILDFSFRHWKEHAPQSKLQLALTLARMGRRDDARLVLDAVMDSAKTDRDLGTFWAPEERAWLWYNDTVETHAWALRALSEIAPGDPRRAGLVQWLFLQKKLNHWKSTRATAEVLYSLASYLEGEQLLGARQEIAVTVGGATTELVFAPDAPPATKRQIVVEGKAIEPARDAVTVVEQRTPGLAFASATWRYTTDRLPARAEGDLLHVERRWYRRVTQGAETTLTPLADGERLAVGDEIEIQLSIRARAAAEYVHLRDPRPAGLEPQDADSGWRWDLGLAYYEATRDSGTDFFFEALPAGELTLKYRLRAVIAGHFRAAPAELQSMYAPEFAAHSAGAELRIVP